MLKQQAIDFDLQPLLCNLFGAVEANWSSDTSPWLDLINGSTYENCAGYDTKHKGLKSVLTYFSYARYLVVNQGNDTANGQVNKTNPFSVPKPLKEVYMESKHYRDMAKATFERVEAFILKNRDDYPGYNYSATKDCGCNGSCGTKTKAKGIGVRSKTISK